MKTILITFAVIFVINLFVFYVPIGSHEVIVCPFAPPCITHEESSTVSYLITSKVISPYAEKIHKKDRRDGESFVDTINRTGKQAFILSNIVLLIILLPGVHYLLRRRKKRTRNFPTQT